MKQLFGNMILSICVNCDTKRVGLCHILTAHVPKRYFSIWAYSVGLQSGHKVIKLSSKLPGARLRCVLPWKPDQHRTKKCKDRRTRPTYLAGCCALSDSGYVLRYRVYRDNAAAVTYSHVRMHLFPQ